MSQKKWQIRKVNKVYLKQLADTLCSPLPVARILMNRGILTPHDAHHFLEPELSTLDNLRDIPFLKQAVLLIDTMISSGAKILVFGDYDADGLTACAILVRFLKKFTQQVEAYVPSRFDEGYGLSEKAVKNILDRKPDLVITVDTGIKDIIGVFQLKKKGIFIIVTDHHVPNPDERPEADLVVSTWDWDARKILFSLSGAGVALALVLEYASFRHIDLTPIEDYLALACIGTIGDVVPLLHENRVIVKYGLKKLNQSPNCGIQALLELSGYVNREIGSEQVGFVLAPRLNAAGRIENPKVALDLLLTEDYPEALNFAKTLNEFNQKRKKEENKVFASLEEDKNNELYMKDSFVVVSGQDWNTGVLGIIASRLSERLFRPVIVLREEEPYAVGSARSITGFNLTEALAAVSHLLVRYGGHEMAAGLKLPHEKISLLRETLNERFAERIQDIRNNAGIVVDAQVTMEDVDHRFMSWLDKLQPFGEKNPNPLFVSSDVTVNERCFSGKNHQRLDLVLMQSYKMKQNRMDAMVMYGNENISELLPCSLIDLIFEVRKSFWDQPYLRILDWRVKK
ncbi:MAG: single-stranded-DNA-specific exonuclease RecJ [Candidatus Atribacteria bacterium]|nr:single-stranded-DNA-specific exonuclease RecJ [Candidatus Atribacteria bacterium]